MQQGSTNYYHPYDSDSGESDDSGSTGSSGSGADITTVQQKAAGPYFSTTKQVELFTNQNQLQTSARGSLPYNQYVSSPTMSLPDSSFSTTGQSQFKTERKDVTTLFLVDSMNRDHTAFPQPTNFTLRPPRAYKTIVSIQITQLKLLCSFFYFQASKGNIILPVIELDRQNANTYLGRNLTKAVTIREGTYAINDLLTEITTQLNFTPIFYDYPNGFTDFVTAFTTNGDFGVNFNEPGDTFYDTLNNKFIPNPTKDYIVKAYWVTRYAGLTTYTIDQIKIAYYYPVLYEVLLDPEDTTAYPYLNLTLTTSTLNPGETVYIRVVFNSQGISDPVILELINNNITYLDVYRTYHTFRYSLVNRYQITYDTNNLRINLFTLTLNTSLLNLFTKTSATSLATALQQQGYTSNNYIVLSNQLSQSQVVFSDMYNYIQNQLVKYFAIDYATYASQFFVNTNNILFIQNGFNASNVRSGYTIGYLTSGTQPLISSVTSYSNSPGYWPKFNVLTSGSIAGGIDPSGVNVSTNMIPYSVTSSNFQFGAQSIDSSNYYVQTNQSTRSIDTIITIKPARYTVMKFRSPCRQTLQVETMPLPYYYRFADYNKQGLYSNVLDPSNNNMPQKYFDISYAFVYNTTGPNKNSYMDQSNYSSLKLNYTYGVNYATSFRSSPSLLLNVQSNLAQFNFTAPPAPAPFASTLSVYETQLTFTSLTSSFPGTVLAFVYHDRAAFMADINTNYQRNEKPLHYIASNIVESNTSQTLTISLSTFTGHSYYTIFRSQALSFQNINYVPSVYQTTSSFVAIKTDYVNFDPLGNPSDASNISNYPFVTNYDTDYVRLPTSSTLQGIDPNNSKYTQSLTVTLKPLGYDISGVSDDLTDYRGYTAGLPGFVPNTQFRIDPISQFTFQKLTEFNTLSNTYFPPGNKNAILSPITNAPYTYKTNSNAEIKIVHWYEGYSIPTQKRDNFQVTDNISSATASSFQGYLLGANSPYSTDQNNNIQFGEGIYAIGFLPQDGLYLVSSFTFKSVLYPITGTSANSQDPNMQIKYIGIYQGSYIANTSLLLMSNALEILTKINTETYAPDTLSNTPQFGVELGTYYTFGYDPSFIPVSKVNLNGYTQSSNQLLSYDALYYAVAFDANGSNITFTQLSGSVLPYPLSQVPSSSSSYFGQTSKNPSGSLQQVAYIMPSTIKYANAAYGPLNGYAYTQSQYEQSQPITTTSIGYRDYGYLTQNNDAFFTFTVAFSTSVGTLSPNNVGLNTFVTEYDSKLWIVNSLSNNSTLSNAGLTFIGANYASSLNTVIINTPGGTLDSIHYLINQPSTIQNYTYSRTSTIFQVFNYASMSGLTNTSTTTQSFTLQPNSPNITVWLWGGGGGSIPSTTTDIYGYQPYGGAGAYVKATINVQQLYSIYGQSNSTISVVIGKGGNRDNFTFTASTTTLNYAQARYGGGGTSIASTINPAIINGSSHTDDILPQGGGFSGLFLGSNILTAIPLLVVGGGGAGGAYSLGGPGGFGLPAATSALSSFYQFSSVTINTTVSLQLPFSNVQDIDTVAFYPGSPITTIIDGNLGTTWNPTGSPYLQPYNFTPTNQTYRINLQFNSNVSSISRLRYYGPNQGDASHPPTGFVVYNNQLKTQVLFSNSAISYANYNTLSNGTFGTTSQLYLDMPITSVISNTTVVTAGYVTTGAAIAESNVIQYSIDGSNWFPTNKNGYRFNPVDARYAGIGLAAKYGNGIWLASGYGQSLSLTNIGSTWSPIIGSVGMQASAMSASGKYQIACSYGRRPYFSSNFGASFSSLTSVGSLGWLAAAISATGQYIVLCAAYQYILISNNYGATFNALTDIGSGYWTGAAISASGQYIWVVLNQSAAYSSTNFGISGSWSGVGYNVSAVAVSGSGQYVTLVSNFGRGAYISNTFGTAWANYTNGYNMNGVSMSSSGKYHLIAGNGFVHFSSNFGQTFTTISSSIFITNEFYGASAMSATGHYMLIGGNSTGWYISTNFGSTWTIYGPNPRIQGFAGSMSADGKYMLMGPYSGQIYQSIATTPTVVYPYIFYSTDGINWSPTTITEYDGAYIRSLCFVASTGLWIAGGASGTYGSFLCSTDGLNWNFGGISNPYVGGESSSVKLLNGNIWSAGNGDVGGKYSTDGFTWTNVSGLSAYDITYGNGRYVGVGYYGSAPYYSGIIHSSDGINWFAANGPFTSVQFFGISVTFGTTTQFPGGVFIAVGLYTNNGTSCRIYYSVNGIKWTRTNDNTVTGIVYNQSLRAVVYANYSFLTVGEGPQQIPYAPNPGANQASVELSIDGLNWTYGLTGGYAPGTYDANFNQLTVGEVGYAVDYGTITAIPNLSTLYMEIQKTSQYQIYFYEIQAFSPTSLLLPQTAGNAITNIIDNNLTTFYWPSEAQTTAITSYPFNFTFSTAVTQVNHLQIYSPLSNLNLLTSITVATDTNGPLRNITSLTNTNFSTASGIYLYDVSFIPSLSNISTLTLTLGKTTTSSLQLTEVTPYYDPSNAATQYLPTSVTDIDNRGGVGALTLQTIISGSLNLNSYWNVNTWNIAVTTQTLRLNFTFNSVAQLNHMQVYSDFFGGAAAHMINGIGVYLDSTKSVVLYSNASPSAQQYKQFMYYDFDITTSVNVTSLYVELSKTTANPNYQPYIYQVAFYNLGLQPGTLGGLTGGLLNNTINQTQTALLIENGGGGTITVGGTAGNAGVVGTNTGGFIGNKYIGGNPAPNSGNAQLVSTFTYMSSIAGGGGGGYYGGGGGGTITTFPTTQSTFLGNYGGAGGGGAGFFSTITSSGGTITTSGGRTFHIFTTNGTFTALPNTSVEIFLIGGGGGGGGWAGGGGGAGNLIILTTTLSADSYSVTIGQGGTGGVNLASVGSAGGSTSFGSIATALGGGGGGTVFIGSGTNGGCGGGGSELAGTLSPGAAITGTVNSGTVIQNLATVGGTGANNGNAGGAGGGGVVTKGSNVALASPVGGNGGAGYLYYGTYYGGGGGGNAGGTYWGTPVIGTGGIGGGGNGAIFGIEPSATSGTPNTGGGGGGAGYGVGASGGSGIVIVSYIYAPIISLVEYGIATVGTGTPSNYIAPGVYQQSTFIGANLLANSGIPYGYGGQPATTGPTGGLGGHGLVILSYDTNITVNPLNTNTASTFLTDASKLSLFQTPIDNTASIRSLTFGTYTEQIQNTSYSNYNWAWYRSYLSLVGGTLTSNLLPSIGTPRVPTTTYSNLPTSVYNIIASQFFNVSTFYNGQNNTVTNAKLITDTLNFTFQVFQSYFVATSYTSSNYTEFTQIYCLLDYLQVQTNLLYPHVNPANATLDRVFGGLPGFGYWANPFLTNTSFVGFDIGPSLTPPSSLAGLLGGPYRSNSMQAMYGLVIEQNLSTGYYTLKDIMSFKPNSTDIALLGSNWAKTSQFNESYVIRNPESVNMDGYISVQPYDFKNAINGRLPLFNYKTYYTNIISGTTVTPSPIHMINDFEGSQTFFYSYQNSNTSNYSSIFITHFPITSTLISLNNQNILDRSNNTTSILGTAISEYTTNTYASTSINIVNKFGYATTSPTNYYPKISMYQGSNSQGSNTNYYNIFSKNSPISSVNVGRLINDYNGNIYSSDRQGTTKVYENICTTQIYMQEFVKEKLAFASPSFVLSNYNAGNRFPYTDFFESKFANIWHLQGSPNMSTLYGARLQSPFDFTITTNFVNQIFYPVHKVTLLKKGAGQNPITQITDLVDSNYPWYPHTEMFFYNNYSTMMYDISGDFAHEKTSNFTNADQFSGYFFDSFINNINLQQSSSFNNNNADSFYYLAVRAYSPSEQFKCLLRMSLPGRYDFGFVTIRDLSNENITIQLPGALVNPDYANVLTQFNSPFTFTSRTFGATGLPGYSGSNISSIQFGDFLRQYIAIYNSIQTNTVIVSSVSGVVTNGITNLISGDLQYILPSTLVNRSKNQDPLQFALYLSTFVNPANQLIDQYGLGYNLGFAREDTGFNSIQRATSFFKILDDYIYLQMNPEYNMNRLDVSRQENFSATQDPTSESQLYNCKLLLNTFGSYAQTVVQNPVFFNPPIGKLDKLSFQWYDITGTLINNTDCEWSAVLQITESVMVATTGSTLPSTS